MHVFRDHIAHEIDVEDSDDQDQNTHPGSQITDVRTMLGQLPPRYREVIQLRWLQKLSAEEIATVMGISVDAANKLMQRALKKLRDAAQSQARI